MDFGKIRLGNWVITKYEKDGVPFIQVKPVSGEFLWEYSAMDEVYPFIEAAIDDKGGHDGFQTCISIIGMFLHAKDPVFYYLYIKCLEEYDKIASVRKPTTHEEELEIINEMRVEYELAEELKKLKDSEE